MNPQEEMRDLKINPLPPEDGIAEVSIDYTLAADDMVLSSIYEIDRHIENLAKDVGQLQNQRKILLDRALDRNITVDKFSELLEIPGRISRILDAIRFKADWPHNWAEAETLDIRRATEKVEKNGPTLGTLETVCGKERVDEYCTTKQAPSSYQVVPRGRI
jgi:hypothetical protein